MRLRSLGREIPNQQEYWKVGRGFRYAKGAALFDGEEDGGAWWAGKMVTGTKFPRGPSSGPRGVVARKFEPVTTFPNWPVTVLCNCRS